MRLPVAVFRPRPAHGSFVRRARNRFGNSSNAERKAVDGLTDKERVSTNTQTFFSLLKDYRLRDRCLNRRILYPLVPLFSLSCQTVLGSCRVRLAERKPSRNIRHHGRRDEN